MIWTLPAGTTAPLAAAAVGTMAANRPRVALVVAVAESPPSIKTWATKYRSFGVEYRTETARHDASCRKHKFPPRPAAEQLSRHGYCGTLVVPTFRRRRIR